MNDEIQRLTDRLDEQQESIHELASLLSKKKRGKWQAFLVNKVISNSFLGIRVVSNQEPTEQTARPEATDWDSETDDDAKPDLTD